MAQYALLSECPRRYGIRQPYSLEGDPLWASSASSSWLVSADGLDASCSSTWGGQRSNPASAGVNGRARKALSLRCGFVRSGTAGRCPAPAAPRHGSVVAASCYGAGTGFHLAS
jgi:hypothetical protein